MWRRAYLFLVLVRLWFALSPSYLHPDENFQGPEVIAGKTISVPYVVIPIKDHTLLGKRYSLTRVYSSCRSNIQLPGPINVGVYERTPGAQCISTMARLWLADASPALAVDGQWRRWRHTTRRRFLDAARAHVRYKLRA